MVVKDHNFLSCSPRFFFTLVQERLVGKCLLPVLQVQQCTACSAGSEVPGLRSRHSFRWLFEESWWVSSSTKSFVEEPVLRRQRLVDNSKKGVFKCTSRYRTEGRESDLGVFLLDDHPSKPLTVMSQLGSTTVLFIWTSENSCNIVNDYDARRDWKISVSLRNSVAEQEDNTDIF